MPLCVYTLTALREDTSQTLRKYRLSGRRYRKNEEKRGKESNRCWLS